MPKAEEVLVGSRPAFETIHPITRIPITYRTHAIIDDPMVGVDDGVKAILAQSPRVDSRDFTWSTDMPAMGAKLFEQNTLLPDTLQKMQVKGKPQSVEFCHLQAGAFASHLFYSVNVNETFHNFVAYVSRFPSDHFLGSHAEIDYKGLKYLRGVYDNLPQNVRDKYDVATPYSFGLSAYKGKRYPVFTTKFVEAGEIGAKFESVTQSPSGKKEGFPIFRHPIPLGPEMDNAERQQVDLVFKILSKYHKWAQSTVSKDWSAFTQSELIKPEMKIVKAQQHDLVQAAAVTYLSSGGLFPAKFSFSSGDFMTTLHDDKFGKVTLITARGGLQKHTVDQWIKSLQSHKTVNADELVFAQLSTDDYHDILGETHNLIQGR